MLFGFFLSRWSVFNIRNDRTLPTVFKWTVELHSSKTNSDWFGIDIKPFSTIFNQFWVCCGCMLAISNTICACLALPPILTPFTSVYMMCVVVPLISTTLVNNEADPEVMNRATGKKHTKFNSKVIAYVMCSYGFKFIPTMMVMVRSSLKCSIWSNE